MIEMSPKVYLLLKEAEKGVAPGFSRSEFMDREISAKENNRFVQF